MLGFKLTHVSKKAPDDNGLVWGQSEVTQKRDNVMMLHIAIDECPSVLVVTDG